MLSIFLKCETILFLLTLHRQRLTVLYVVKSNCFVVHYLMLLQILINSVYSFSVHGVHLKNSSSFWPDPQEKQCPTESFCFFSNFLPPHRQVFYRLLQPFGRNPYNPEPETPRVLIYEPLSLSSHLPLSRCGLGLAPEVSFAEGLGCRMQLTPSHQDVPPHPPFLREDGCMQGRERVGRIVASLILGLDPIPP